MNDALPHPALGGASRPAALARVLTDHYTEGQRQTIIEALALLDRLVEL